MSDWRIDHLAKTYLELANLMRDQGVITRGEKELTLEIDRLRCSYQQKHDEYERLREALRKLQRYDYGDSYSASPLIPSGDGDWISFDEVESVLEDACTTGASA